MRSLGLLIGLFVSGLGAAAIAAGCGGGGDTGAGGAGGTGSSSVASSSSKSASKSSAVSSVTSSSSGGDNNNSFDTATDLTLGMTVDADLAPTGDVDYYKFQGKKGDAMIFFIAAQGSMGAFDPDYVNTVITLYDASKTQIAENNDPTPLRNNDSELFTILPADGQYYLKVTECWTWAANPGSTCAGSADKGTTAYSLGGVVLDPMQAGNVADGEKGNDETTANPVTYAPVAGGGYYLSVLWGPFNTVSDVDVYSFNLPVDAQTPAANERVLINNWIMRGGTSGNGSTTAGGKMYITTKAAPTTKIAEIDPGNFSNGTTRLWPPITPGTDYLLWVTRPQPPPAMVGVNDFYFTLHGSGISNPLEQKDLMNDDPMTPEIAIQGAGTTSYYIEGDLDLAKMPPDVDHYSVDVSGVAGKKVYAYCGGWRAGSGLRGMKVELLHGAGAMKGMPLAANATATEGATTDPVTPQIPLPAGESTILVKLSAASQDPNVTSSFYRCGIHFM